MRPHISASCDIRDRPLDIQGGALLFFQDRLFISLVFQDRFFFCRGLETYFFFASYIFFKNHTYTYIHSSWIAFNLILIIYTQRPTNFSWTRFQNFIFSKFKKIVHIFYLNFYFYCLSDSFETVL